MSPATTLRGLGVVVVVLAAMMTSTASASPSPHAPLAVTTEGLVRGVATPAGAQFLGVPYAAPPVGGLRWQPPQPAARWHGIRDATQFGSACAQVAGSFGRASTAEDCLYLNVYTPPNPAHHRPVMVWIHGGGLVNGSSDLYDPTGLVQDGAVVVTINYRLGAFGFLAHGALAGSPGGPSGDYGLMDQQAALRWVQRNIAWFGGDPRNVTIFGESAGGLSVLSQLVSPGARGLFDRAIAQSGAYALTQQSLAEAEAAGNQFAAAAGCADQTAACLRALPVTTVLAHQGSGYEPNIDGKVLTQSLGPALASGQFTRVPVINGSNRDEWRLFVAQGELQGQRVTADNYLTMIQGFLGVPPQAAAVIAAQYPLSAYPSPPLAFSAVGTDAVFACPALAVNTSLSKYVPTFGYEFNDENAPPLLPPVSFPQGAAHGTELEYLFKLPIGGPLSPDQERLAAAMRDSWAGFAASGRPPAPWPQFTPAKQQLLSLIHRGRGWRRTSPPSTSARSGRTCPSTRARIES